MDYVFLVFAHVITCAVLWKSTPDKEAAMVFIVAVSIMWPSTQLVYICIVTAYAFLKSHLWSYLQKEFFQ